MYEDGRWLMEMGAFQPHPDKNYGWNMAGKRYERQYLCHKCYLEFAQTFADIINGRNNSGRA